MTLEEKIGQLFMISLAGPELSASEIDFIRECKIGNFIYFARNLTDYQQVTQLSKSLFQHCFQNTGVAPIIALDQEGGMVVRLFSGATAFPSNMALTAAGAQNKLYSVGKMVGEELHRLGITMNLAPVLDVNNNSQNPVIGIRAYSDDPEVVANMGIEYIRGLQEAGIMACAKHFPGHGDTKIDSHLGLPIIEHNQERLEKLELKPFRKAIEHGVAAIMMSHIVYPALDASLLPASLSPKITQELLREKLSYTGLICTDSLSMGAIMNQYGPTLGALLALKAGADLLCLCNSISEQRAAYHLIHSSVIAGTLDVAIIDAACARIAQAKNKFINASNNAQDKIKSVQAQARYPEHEALAQELSQKSITLLRDAQKLLPLDTKKKILVIAPPPVRLNQAENSRTYSPSFAPFMAQMFTCVHYEMSIDPSKGEQEKILTAARAADIILFASYNAVLNKGQAELIKMLCVTCKKIIHVALRLPYDAQLLSADVTCLLSYEYTEHSLNSLAAVLRGEFIAQGICPVQLS